MHMKSELQKCFPFHGLMNALGILYLQYWKANVKPEAIEMNFPKHLHVMVDFYGYGRMVRANDLQMLVPPVID